MEPIIQLTCQRCGHGWIPNIPSPTVCPRCHSPYWRIPRKNGKRFADVKQVVPDTVHTEPLMTGTPQISVPTTGIPQVPTPQYQPPSPYYPPPQYIPSLPRAGQPIPLPPQYQPPVPQYLPPPVDYGQPPIRFPSPQPMYQEPQIIWKEQPVSEAQEDIGLLQINPDTEMPHPLRKCKLCGYKGYGEYFKNHQCRR